MHLNEMRELRMFMQLFSVLWKIEYSRLLSLLKWDVITRRYEKTYFYKYIMLVNGLIFPLCTLRLKRNLGTLFRAVRQAHVTQQHYSVIHDVVGSKRLLSL